MIFGPKYNLNYDVFLVRFLANNFAITTSGRIRKNTQGTTQTLRHHLFGVNILNIKTSKTNVVLATINVVIGQTIEKTTQECVAFYQSTDDDVLPTFDVLPAFVLRIALVLCTLLVLRHGRNVSKNAFLNFGPPIKYMVNSKALLQ